MMRLNIEYPIDREAYEFKNSLNGLDKGIKALAAMLNRNGKGEVFFGVSKEGDVTGLKGQIGVETIKMVEERISEVLKPAVTPTTIIEEYGGKKVIHVIVKGNDKPYAANGDYRIRIEDGNKKIDSDLMAKLFYESDRTALDSIESVEQNLSFSLLSFYLKNNGIEVDKDTLYSDFGLKINDKYINLLNSKGKKEKILMSQITEYKTNYLKKEESVYKNGAVYVNEFRINKAAVKTVKGATCYVEKQIYPFPEGIAITFKSKGASLQGSWNLIALEKVEMQDGAITYGYDNDIKRKNSINPSSTELTEGISSISFAYLSPGFYALVNEDSNASYIIKIVK